MIFVDTNVITIKQINAIQPRRKFNGLNSITLAVICGYKHALQ